MATDVLTVKYRNNIAPADRSWGDEVVVYADTAANNGRYILTYNHNSTKKKDNSNWVKMGVIHKTILAADVANADATPDTLADITGLSFPVKSGRKYKFKFFITYTSAATTTGSRWTINGPTVTNLDYRSTYSLTATSQTVNEGLAAYNLPAAANASSAATASNIAVVEGTIQPSADGSVIARSASEITVSAITAIADLSYVEWEELYI